MTVDPILTTPNETLVWDLEDGTPMPPDGTRYCVLREDVTHQDDGTVLRVIRRVLLEK